MTCVWVKQFLLFEPPCYQVKFDAGKFVDYLCALESLLDLQNNALYFHDWLQQFYVFVMSVDLQAVSNIIC